MISTFVFKSAIAAAYERKSRAWLTGFLIGSLLAVMILTMSGFDVWTTINRRSDLIYQGSHVITIVSCSVYAVVILVLRLSSDDSEKWADYIGDALILMVMHHMALLWLVPLNDTATPNLKASIFSASLSAFSNVLLVAASLILLNRPPFPKWNIVTQIVFAASGILLSLKKIPCYRFPEAIASAFCIYWVGYAFYRNIRHANSGFSGLTRKFVVQVVWASVVLYALTGLFQASIPFMANWNWNARLLDSVAILVFFLLKFAIFHAALFLFLGSIIFVSSKHANEIFDPIVHGVGEYLDDDGITRLIADRLDTASTVLYVKIPGKRKTLYAKFAWPLKPDLESDRRIKEEEIEALALEAIIGGTEQTFCPPYDKGSVSDYFQLALGKRLPTKVAVPIIFHGAVIGCLLAVSKPDRNFSPREIQHLKDLTKLSAMSAQSFRENAALDKLSYKLTKILNPNPVVEGFDKSIDRVAELLQDVLDPLATGIWLDVGIQQHVSLKGPEEYKLELRSRIENAFSGASAQEDDTYEVLSLDIKVIQPETRRDKWYTIGKLAILVPAKSDMVDRPILGRNKVFFRAVTARTASSVLGITMEFLNSVIQEFGVRINNVQQTNIQEWFTDVEAAAAMAGLLWIMAEIPSGNPFFGRPEAVENAQRLQSRSGREDGRYLREAPLNLSKGKLLIAVQGSRYHNMQNVCSLWRSFFFRFAETVDSAFQRWILYREREAARLEQEAARSYEFATIAVTTPVIIHQLVNTTRDISLPLKALHNAYLVGKLQCADKRVGKLLIDLPQSASSLVDLAAGFIKLSDTKENVKCNLRQAIGLAERLFALQLRKRGITLEIDIPSSLTIGVPPLVAEMALATLIGNSGDATPNGGHIRIGAWEEGDMIRCDVTDNGHGVPAEVQSRLFRGRNVTTKPNGNGWGLYLVSRSLRDRHGSIELTNSRPGETTFTLRFPKYSGRKGNQEMI
jgi:histidine kinase/DNA gyrase B/HSP90-like ATPase